MIKKLIQLNAWKQCLQIITQNIFRKRKLNMEIERENITRNNTE